MENIGSVSKEFLDTFCIDLAELPIEDYDNMLKQKKVGADYMTEDGKYISYEGYINFRANGTTYLTRECKDVVTYLESLGYAFSKTPQTFLAKWYAVDSLLSMLKPESKLFRKYFALALLENGSTIQTGNIGTTEEEIHKSVERVKREEPIFFDDPEEWLKTDTGRRFLIRRDELIYNSAFNYMNECLKKLGYCNVYLIKDCNIDDRKNIIKYWLKSNGIDEEYTFSEEYIERAKKDEIREGALRINDDVDELLRFRKQAKSIDEVKEALKSMMPENKKEVIDRTDEGEER